MKPTRHLRFALILGVLLLAGLACTREISPSGGEAAGTPEPPRKELTGFTQIAGTKLLIAGIFGGDRGSSWDFSLRSGSSYAYSVYNYVFFDMQTEQFQALLPTNEQAIINKIGLPICCENSAEEPIRWWLYSVVKADTNEDELLTSADQFTLAMSEVGGTGYVELVPGVDESLGEFMPSETVLFFFYRQNDQKYFAKIDLPGRAVLSTTPLPSFGEDVK